MTFSPEHEIERILEDLAAAAEELETLALDEGRKEALYKRTFWPAYLSAKTGGKVSDKTAEATAQVACAELLERWIIAQKLHRAKKDTVEIMKHRLDGCRTLAASHRMVTG